MPPADSPENCAQVSERTNLRKAIDERSQFRSNCFAALSRLNPVLGPRESKFWSSYFNGQAQLQAQASRSCPSRTLQAQIDCRSISVGKIQSPPDTFQCNVDGKLSLLFHLCTLWYRVARSPRNYRCWRSGVWKHLPLENVVGNFDSCANLLYNQYLCKKLPRQFFDEIYNIIVRVTLFYM